MQLTPGRGVDNLVFGMQKTDIVKMLGKADRIFKAEDDENELIYQYNKLKLRLTFYEQEDGRLGYIRCANPAVEYDGRKIIGEPAASVAKDVFGDDMDFEVEVYDFFDTYLDAESWIVLNVDYGNVTDIEIGVPYDDEEEVFVWPE
jgi:hypothetical protein